VVPPINISRRTWIEITLVVAVTVVSIYAHVSLGYVCPLPWPDEAHFLWPAISMAEHGTFVSPELNPDRPIFWMPHGYMTIVGGLFAITGGSLAVARGFSLVCVLAGLAIFLAILRRRGFSLLSSFIAAWFFVNAYFVGCGNIARMEAPLLVLVLVAFLCLFDKRILTAIGLMLFAPLLHPNGFYFLAATIIYASFDWWRAKSRPRVTKTGAVIVAIAAVCGIVYAIYLSGYWSFVKQDLAFQFARKAERSVIGQILTIDNLALLILLLGAVAMSWRSGRRRLSLLMLALPCWAIQVVGFEMWYRVFWMLAALIVTVLFVESVCEFVKTRFTAVHRYAHYALIGVITCLALGWHLYRGNLESPVNYPYAMKFFEMSTPDGTPYLTNDDKDRVARLIQSESTTQPVTVQFFPRAEALLYLNLRSDRVKFFDPLFYERQADLYIFHESKYLPVRWLRFLAKDMNEAGLNPQDRGKFVAFERDNHERWYVYRRPK
jgi:hypothetical protein